MQYFSVDGATHTWRRLIERPLLYPHRIVVVPLRFWLKSPFFNRGHRIVVISLLSISKSAFFNRFSTKINERSYITRRRVSNLRLSSSELIQRVLTPKTTRCLYLLCFFEYVFQNYFFYKNQLNKMNKLECCIKYLY